MEHFIFVALLACTQEKAPVARETARSRTAGVPAEDVPPEPPEPEDTGMLPEVGEDPDGGRLLYTEGVVHTIALTIGEDAIESLDDEPEVDVEASFELDDEEVAYPIGLHLKGTSSFRPMSRKPAFRVDFHQWDPEARFHGIKRLALNNMVQDATMLHEHAYAWLCSRLGIPAPRHGFAHVFVNGEDFGLYGIVESMDEQLIGRLWPDADNGPLYEGYGNDFTIHDADFEVKEASDALAIEDLVRTIDATPPDEYLPMLEANFDLRALLGYWALDLATGNPDGYVLHRNNFCVYGDPVLRRWSLLPSGTDRSFELPVGGGSVISVLGSRCVADDACGALLDARVVEIADAWDELGFVPAVQAMADLIEPFCRADPRIERLCRVEEMVPFIEGRAAEIREEYE